MGISKEYLIQIDDYNRLISSALHKIAVVESCPHCHMEYLTGKNEEKIYGYVTNVFKKEFGEHYNNKLMKELIKKYLNERFYDHECDKIDD